MKNGILDVAICPGCGFVHTRENLYLWKQANPKYCYECTACGYGYYEFPYRPLTIAEMLGGRKPLNVATGVNLDVYTIALSKRFLTGR